MLSAYIVSTKHGANHRPVVPRQDELAIRIVVGGDLLAGGSLAQEIANTVNRRAAAEAVVRAVPVVEVLQLGEPVFELRISQIDRRPELFESGSLHPFDFSIEMGCTWPDRSELDAPLAKALLHPIGKELLAPVCLDALNGKRHFLDHLFEGGQGRSRGFSLEDPNHLVPRTVIDSCVLIEPRTDA